MIFPRNSEHEESDVYNHFWRRSNGKVAQALFEHVTIGKNSNKNCFTFPRTRTHDGPAGKKNPGLPESG